MHNRCITVNGSAWGARVCVYMCGRWSSKFVAHTSFASLHLHEILDPTKQEKVNLQPRQRSQGGSYNWLRLRLLLLSSFFSLSLVTKHIEYRLCWYLTSEWWVVNRFMCFNGHFTFLSCALIDMYSVALLHVNLFHLKFSFARVPIPVCVRVVLFLFSLVFFYFVGAFFFFFILFCILYRIVYDWNVLTIFTGIWYVSSLNVAMSSVGMRSRLLVIYTFLYSLSYEHVFGVSVVISNHRSIASSLLLFFFLQDKTFNNTFFLMMLIWCLPVMQALSWSMIRAINRCRNCIWGKSCVAFLFRICIMVF